MKTFRSYLTESKNTHLTHLEDQMFDEGTAGLLTAVQFIGSLVRMLSSSSKSTVKVTTKWDGAPAIVCGTDPSNGKFFVGTKSVFNSQNPKINYSTADIDKNHEGQLANKLKIAFTHLKPLGIKEILQGDLLFTSQDLQTQEIDGQSCVTFRPNTITYAVPTQSDLANKISGSKIGVVFHTKYTGSSLSTASASFDVNINKLKSNKNAWIIDAYFKDLSGTATFTANETAQIVTKIKSIRTLLSGKSKSLLNELTSSNILPYMHMYFNAKVKQGESLADVQEHVDGLITFIKLKFNNEIQKLKTEKGKSGKKEVLNSLINFIEQSRQELYNLYTIQKLIIECKLMIVSKLQKIKTVGTFIKTENGFRVTSPEGFVAVSSTDTALKLVDRLEFSKDNFTVAKDWS